MQRAGSPVGQGSTRDEAGGRSEDSTLQRTTGAEETLVPLSRLQARDDDVTATLDVRGYEVSTPAFTPVGTVVDLHVDLATGRVRYLEVQEGGPGEACGRRLLLPIGCARIDQVLDRIVVSRMPSPELLPVLGAETLDRDTERRILAAFGSPGGSVDFYTDPAFDESAFLGGSTRAEPASIGRREDDRSLTPEQRSSAQEEQLYRDATGTEIRVVDDD